MKKLLVAILAFLYISTSTGAILHLHYCMGKLSGWDLGKKDSKDCSKCGMEKSSKKDKGCCKDEQKLIKNDTDQKTVENILNQFTRDAAAGVPGLFFELPGIDIPLIAEKIPLAHAPPQANPVALYIRNRVFLL